MSTPLRPKRERLAEATAATAGIADPREAWEACATAGLLGTEDVETPRRAFAGGTVVAVETIADSDGLRVVGRTDRGAIVGLPADRVPRSQVGTTVVQTHPAAVADCVALAADWPGVLAAEAIAREALGDRRVVWRLLSRAEVKRDVTLPVLAGPQDLLGRRRASYLILQGLRPQEVDSRVLEAFAGLVERGYVLGKVSADAVALLGPALEPRTR